MQLPEKNKMYKILEQLKVILIKQEDKAQRGIVSWKYGTRINPITKLKQFHNGIDLPAPKGTPIFCPWDAKVALIAFAQKDTKKYPSGNFLQLLHPKNKYIVGTRYAHLYNWNKEILEYLEKCKKEDKLIKAGEIIGYVGNTGRSTGAHLHFILRVEKAYQIGGLWRKDVDPLEYLLSSLE